MGGRRYGRVRPRVWWPGSGCAEGRISMSLHLESRFEQGVRILSLEGEVDAQTVGPFDRAMDGFLEAGEVRIVLDCSALSFMASVGLGVLMGVLGPIQDAGGTIVLAAIQEDVRHTLDLLDFSALFPMAATVPEAVRLAAPVA